MVPKVAKGKNFTGAGRYFLHDKRREGEAERYTTERVEFTHIINIPTQDGWKAIKWMAHTAMHAEELKRAAIDRGEDISLKGRKGTKPVYAYSLSWHPEQNPTKEEMLEAATQSLKANNLDQGYETLMVAHNDEPQPHIHIIVNRVHPETGVMAPLSKDYLNLSKWAEKYERETGQIYCQERVANNERRRQGEYVKDARSHGKAEFYRWRAEDIRQAAERRETASKTLSDTHKQQRQDLYLWKENLISNRRAELKEERKPYWADLFRTQRQETRLLEFEQSSAWQKAGYFTSHRDPDQLLRRRIITEAFNALTGGKQQREALEKHQKQERQAVANFFAEQTKTDIKKINANYRRRLDKLKDQQRAERAAQQKLQSKESQERAKEIAEGKDVDRFDPDTFRKARADKKREELRDTGRDISKTKPKLPKKEELSEEKERPDERELYEGRQRERERQRQRRRGLRPKGPKPPKFRR